MGLSQNQGSRGEKSAFLFPGRNWGLKFFPQIKSEKYVISDKL